MTDHPATIWAYVETSKQVGDPDHLKVFATTDAAEKSLKETKATQLEMALRKPFGNGATDDYNDDDGKAH
jgi:hypothetical protein